MGWMDWRQCVLYRQPNHGTLAWRFPGIHGWRRHHLWARLPHTHSLGCVIRIGIQLGGPRSTLLCADPWSRSEPLRIVRISLSCGFPTRMRREPGRLVVIICDSAIDSPCSATIMILEPLQGNIKAASCRPQESHGLRSYNGFLKGDEDETETGRAGNSHLSFSGALV